MNTALGAGTAPRGEVGFGTVADEALASLRILFAVLRMSPSARRIVKVTYVISTCALK